MSTLTNVIADSVSQDSDELILARPRDPFGAGTFLARGFVGDDVVITPEDDPDVSALSFPLKAGAAYVFGFDIIYSAAGTTVGAQFGVGVTGTVEEIVYGLTLVAVDDSVISAVADEQGQLIGSEDDQVAGGPKTARIAGYIRMGGNPHGGVLSLHAGTVGEDAVSVTVNAGTIGRVEEC